MADAKRLPVGLPTLLGGGTPSASNFALNANTDAAEWIFQADEAGAITRLGYRLGAITGTTPIYRISLQGVDASGDPDGTVKGGGSPASKTFSPSSLGQSAGNWYWIDLDNSYTCTRGEMLAAVIGYSSGTVDGSNNASFTTSYVGMGTQWGLPYSIQNDAGSRTRSAAVPIFGYGTAGTAYGHPLKTLASQSFNSGATPDEYAILFTLPAGWCDTFKVAGVVFWWTTIPSGHVMRVTLYDTDGTTVLQQVDADTDAASATSGRLAKVLFDEVALSTLTAGSTYRLSLAPQSATTQATVILTVDAAADFAAWPGGTDFTLSTRTDAGAWTDDATRRLFAGLLLADLTEPAGGGSTLNLYAVE